MLAGCMHVTVIFIFIFFTHDQCYQEYMRTRVGNSRSFCYGCCHAHGRVLSSPSLPTSVCTKKGKTFILERWAQRWTLFFDEHMCMQSAGLAWNASQKDWASGASEHARVQRWVHNDLKKEWLCVIDDELRILPWQKPKYGVAYSCSHVLLVLYLPGKLSSFQNINFKLGRKFNNWKKVALQYA